jgi:hypothetical protein
MIEVTRAQLHKYVVRAMVVINMSSISSKVIRRETCLQAKSPFGLSKNPRPKRHPNI